jgi:hypothetical protein
MGRSSRANMDGHIPQTMIVCERDDQAKVSLNFVSNST